MNWTSFIDEMNDDLRELNKTLPETTKAFSALTRAAKEGGVLDLRTKEFVAIAIAVATRCDPCIGFHVRALAKADLKTARHLRKARDTLAIVVATAY